MEAENADEKVGSLMYSFSTEMLKNKSYIRIEFNYLYQGQLSTLKTIFTDRDTYQIFEYNEATGALLNWK